ncbi:hypothetical protein [Paenibacillus xylaniclasticus]|uniref:hypothetical protein n=1 Tax=Paenibacillus xylaniclasticus TaxID=588083 RepID=UPI000FD9D660|nr:MULTISPECIES: hypothetical protein [Paenibacillus]GFN31510.1 hypothetical protein PCURB6_17700 [Paenibacillus curdlanolyticus]
MDAASPWIVHELEQVSLGTNMMIWFANSGFILVKYHGLRGNTALFGVGSSILRVNVSEIKAILI